MISKTAWVRWLEAVLVLVLAYSILLVVAGSVAGSLFSAFGFGPADVIDTDEVRDYLKLPYMVLGAVLAGWAFTMLQLARGPLRDGATWVVPLMGRSFGLWFVLDTGMSLALGYPTHALFNVPFGVALAIPLVRLRAS
ncbi:MAG: hypothetical protein ACKOBT_10475 [Actinomycetota bacterium]